MWYFTLIMIIPAIKISKVRNSRSFSATMASWMSTWQHEIVRYCFKKKIISLVKSLSGWSPSINHAGLSLMTRNHMVGKRPPPSCHLPPHGHQSKYMVLLLKIISKYYTYSHTCANIYIKYIHKTYKVHSQIPKLYGFFYRLPTWNNKAQNSPTHDHAHGFYY